MVNFLRNLKIPNAAFKKIKKRILYMKNNAHIFRYDYFGIFLRYFKLPIFFKNKYVCSYFVANLLEEAGVCRFKKKTIFIEPKDFELISNKKEIYSGKFLNCK